MQEMTVTKSKSLLDGWIIEHEFAPKVGKSVRALRKWRQLQIGPAWAEFGKQIYYRDNAAQVYLAANEKNPVRSQRRAKP
jgi:hypothetical protein